MIADLTQPDALPADTFDCVILTQTLQFIYEVRATLATVERALRPGGVLLLTVPGIAQISREDMDRWGDFWRFTTLAVSRLLDEAFPGGVYEVSAFGNVLAAVAFLEGVASEELADDELDHIDPNYELVIAARVAKPGGAG
jgi:SAM-dependent methyltransferase